MDQAEIILYEMFFSVVENVVWF